MNEQVY
jgi:hypothetical protein